ncbi:MAG TPA: TetR/AcrR family transcriptional regulator [Terriglobales bacterium]|nr:TetR/AcrR family transcriptional regulator [Terriglobales bacterium]
MTRRPTMRAVAVNGRTGTRGEPEITRGAILDAALREFAEKGMAGARTDAIAHAAGVNKALLYYYFGDKEKLYAAVLDGVFAELCGGLTAVLGRDLPPREKILAYAAAHFDFMAHRTARWPMLPQLVHREMMQSGHHASPVVRQIAVRYLRPVFGLISTVLQEGIRRGDFRPVDPRQFTISMVGIIVHYFVSAPLQEAITGEDPLAPERLAARREAVLDLIGAALFEKPPGISRRMTLLESRSKVEHARQEANTTSTTEVQGKRK